MISFSSRSHDRRVNINRGEREDKSRKRNGGDKTEVGEVEEEGDVEVGG